MAKHSVNVLIKARDEASKKFKTIGLSAVNMGSMLKKAAAAVAFYFGARAIKNYLQASLAAYAEQEKSTTKLAQALEATGYATGFSLY